MKVKVLKPVTLDVNAIQCAFRLDEDDGGVSADFPGRDDETLTIVLELDTGKVRGWPEGRAESLHLKPCDSGVYTLLSGYAAVESERDDYVPECLPGEYGDYFICDIAADGSVSRNGNPWRPRSKDVADFFFPS